MRRLATISPCGVYRYDLLREWDPTRPRCLWVMLNPSTADAEVDDPTIRRCIGFSRDWGYGGVVVVNLFALRATNPAAIRAHIDPIGPEDDRYIEWHATRPNVGQVVVAWGAHGKINSRGLIVGDRLSAIGAAPQCLGTVRGGHPKHPLYVPADTPLKAWAA